MNSSVESSPGISLDDKGERDRIQTQLLELNALLDEIGLLHKRLRIADPTLATSAA